MRLSVATILPWGAVLVLGLWPLAAPGAEVWLQVLGYTSFFAALALAWNIFALTGSLSLGHAAFFGLGAYGAVLLEQWLALPVLLAVPLGALAGGVYGCLWAAAFPRLRGAYFALASLAALEIPKVIVDNWDTVTSGSMGIAGISRLPSLVVGGRRLLDGGSLGGQYYYLVLLLLGVALVHAGVLRSRWGWALRALRENEAAAAALGLNPGWHRCLALTLSAGLTGLCGAVYAHLIGQIEPTLVFSLHLAAFPLVLCLFGGRFTPWGPVAGAFLLYPLDQLLLHPIFPQGHSAVYGVMIILTVFFFPGGIVTWLRAPRRPY